MAAGLWFMGMISLGTITGEWEEKLYVEGEIASKAECSLRLNKGWHANRRTDFESLVAYWPSTDSKQMWVDIGLEAVHRDKNGRLIQLDTKHFQHRLRYRGQHLVSIHTRDDWEEHEYVVVWKDGMPVRLVGYLEHIELSYDPNRILTQAIETWLDEPEVKRVVSIHGTVTDGRFPLPFSMGWLFTRRGKLNEDWLRAWWLSKQRFPDALASVH